MTGNLIVTTSKASMQALAFQGIMAYSSFPQIRAMLLNKFGDEFVLLFARPVENTATGQIDWYTPVQGTPRKLLDLPAEEKETVYKRLHVMGSEIHAFAEELIHSNDPHKVTRGNMLKLALCYPSDEALYVVGQQPVFTCWGFAPGTAGVEGKNLARLAAPAAQPAPRPSVAGPAQAPATPAPQNAGKGGWLWWALCAIPLLMLVPLLFGSFGSLPAISGHTMFNLPDGGILPRAADRKQEIEELKSQIAILETDVEKHAALCKPAREPAVKSPETLVIPENARDTSFLEGRWLCQTGLGSTRSGEAVKVAFSFGDGGLGEAVIIERNNQCRGPAKASLDKGSLHIDIDELKCSHSGTSYGKMAIDCENSAGSATFCKGVNSDGTTWDAIFHRMR